MIALLAAALQCAALPGAAPLLKPSRMLLVGEMHGTREIPRVIASLACLAVQAHVPVVVALEMPQEDAPRLEAWAASQEPRSSLLQGAFWRRPFQDGRSSEAMAWLLEELRRLRVRVVPYDPVEPDGRDRKMAERLAALRAEVPASLIIVLSGNLHNRTTEGVPWDPKLQPMGWHLTQRGIAVTSLQVVYARGSTWMCESSEPASCGPHPLGGKDRGPSPAIQIGHELPHVQGTIYVGPISPSLPAASRPAG